MIRRKVGTAIAPRRGAFGGMRIRHSVAHIPEHNLGLALWSKGTRIRLKAPGPQGCKP